MKNTEDRKPMQSSGVKNEKVSRKKRNKLLTIKRSERGEKAGAV